MVVSATDAGEEVGIFQTVIDNRAVTEWPKGALYHSSLGLFPFQQESIAEMYLRTEHGGGVLVCWDTGTGKSHAAMRLDTLLAEDMQEGLRTHDLTMLICEKAKISEWAEDFSKFTTRVARVHIGTGRMARLTRDGLPDVLVTTYETAKADLAKIIKSPPGKRGTSMVDGPLMTLIQPLKVLWVFDEMPKLRNRTSANYKVFDRTLRHMKKSHPTDHRVFGLTATPIETGWEDAFNQVRLIRPDLMPSVGDFEAYFVKGRDPYDRPRYHEARMHEFALMCRPVIMRKRKSDPDVVAQFPKKVEEVHHVVMGPDQEALYELVESLDDLDDDEPIPGLWTALRQVAGHPPSIALSARTGQSKLAKTLVEELGEDYFLNTSSVKEKALLDYVKPLVKGQGAKVVVFTFFGQTILPLLARSLRAAGMKVYDNHGGLTSVEMGAVRRSFKEDSKPCIFLTSDAGARGINLPEATYVVEYESALTYANRTQRLDRIHRIDSESLSVTCMTFVVDHTKEVSIIQRMSKRNEQTDMLLGDDDAGEGFMTASERREVLKLRRLSTKSRSR
jgi:SNF2 family DNA or RNA helicase